MPCTVDLFNNPEQRIAAKWRIKLLQHTGEWDLMEEDDQSYIQNVTSGYYYGSEQVRLLCERIKSLGDTAYLDNEIENNPTPALYGIYAWWQEHLEKDRIEEERRRESEAKQRKYDIESTLAQHKRVTERLHELGVEVPNYENMGRRGPAGDTMG